MSKLFEELEPPPGGTTRLLARIDEDAKRRTTRARLLAAAAGLSVAAIAIFATVGPTQRTPLDESWLHAPGLSTLGLTPAQAEPLVASGASTAVRVPVANPSVVFYLVGSAAE